MNTTNRSRVTPKTAGIESSAKTTSVTSMATRATSKGVAMIWPPDRVRNRPPSYLSLPTGRTRRRPRTTRFSRGADGIARAEHANPGQQDQRAEGVEDPAQMLNERTTGGNEAAPEQERAHHPEVEHPALQRGRDRERGEQQHEDEDVVDAERFLQQIAGEILPGGGLAPPQPQEPAEGKPGRDPQSAQHRGGACTS